MGIILAVFVVLIGKLIYITVTAGKEYEQKVLAQQGYTSTIIPAKRGDIYDANGTVLAVNDDGMFGHNVWIDHGNGYVTIYRNSGDVKVKQGESVTKGTTLFIIKDAQSKLGYQIMQDGEYRNPMEILAISG